MNSHYNKTTIRTSNNLKNTLTTEHEAIQNLNNTIQIIEKTHNILRKNKTCNTCAHSLGIIRGLKKTIKKIEKANKNLKRGNTKMSWRWGHWICRHENLDKLIRNYHLISNSNHQIVNHVAEHQQEIQAGLDDWKKNSKRIREEAITELAKLAQEQKLVDNPTN